MDPQKGIDIALRGLSHCKNDDWQAIILGTGIPYVEEMALQLEADYPDRVRSIIKFDGKLAHQLYAGADIFMMPSRYEPCGLSQLISMRYGCVPIARAPAVWLTPSIIHRANLRNPPGSSSPSPIPLPSQLPSSGPSGFTKNRISGHKIQANGMQADFPGNTPLANMSPLMKNY